MIAASAYLNFNGNCKEAFDLYHKVLGGDMPMTVTMGQAPGADPNDPDKDKIMHTRLVLPNGSIIMGSDAMGNYYKTPQGFSVSITLDSAEDGKRIFDALAEGGQIQMPYEKTFWAEGFGAFVDRFGTPWMVNAGMVPF
jgi:PhnB protein